MRGGGNWITLDITKESDDTPWSEAKFKTDKKINIVPICYFCEKAPYKSSKKSSSGWCKLVGDTTIPEWSSDTKLKGIESKNLSEENKKCKTDEAVNEWTTDNDIDLKVKLSKQIECLNFFVCNSCDRNNVVTKNKPKEEPVELGMTGRILKQTGLFMMSKPLPGVSKVTPVVRKVQPYKKTSKAPEINYNENILFNENILNSLISGKTNVDKIKEYFLFCNKSEEFDMYIRPFLETNNYLLDDINETNRLYLDPQNDLKLIKQILKLAFKITDSVFLPFGGYLVKAILNKSGLLDYFNAYEAYNLFVREFNKTVPFRSSDWVLPTTSTTEDKADFETNLTEIKQLYNQGKFKESRDKVYGLGGEMGSKLGLSYFPTIKIEELNTCDDGIFEKVLTIDLEPIGMGHLNVSKNLIQDKLEKNKYYTSITIGKSMVTDYLADMFPKFKLDSLTNIPNEDVTFSLLVIETIGIYKYLVYIKNLCEGVDDKDIESELRKKRLNKDKLEEEAKKDKTSLLLSPAKLDAKKASKEYSNTKVEEMILLGRVYNPLLMGKTKGALRKKLKTKKKRNSTKRKSKNNKTRKSKSKNRKSKPKKGKTKKR